MTPLAAIVAMESLSLAGLARGSALLVAWQVSRGHRGARVAAPDYCMIFLVTIRGKVCVMKVHHSQGPKQYWDSEIRETNIFVCESTAYRRLTQAGVCARGITPQFYGTIENIDPTRCLPHLHAFVKDEHPPTAILLEYIPNMETLTWSNYSGKRMENFVDGLNAIHDALVSHDDVHPRNMMIFKGHPERAIWLDFDKAQTYTGELTEIQKGWVAFETLLIAEIAEFMKHDFDKGEYDKTRQYYR
ncbi:hypothetical protein AJ79_07513 [Helicocarpus griseus UAMH5409]|uniref:Protein kinase domain-containing protein n=1 Tax=Helicocarpus griseus UAMH5409 TaxID=1447875 RepID=A0A2B7X268_9EURO|nr:hypothetical protein AJ79_07513 [Helicocarpus griseus UAMH5409]